MEMTKEEIQALITAGVEAVLSEKLDAAIAAKVVPVIDGLSTKVETYVTEAINSAIQADPKPQTESASEDDKSPAAARLKVLEEKLAKTQLDLDAKATREAELEFQSALAETVGKFKPLHQKDTLGLLSKQFSGAVKTDKGWQVNGKLIDEAATEFFATDFGKHLLPSAAKSGAGTAQPENTGAPKPSATEMLNQAF